MRRPRTKRTCKHCQTCFDPDPRSAGRQRYGAKPECRKASKATRPRRWQQQPHNRDSFNGPPHVERVRQGRKAQPGYWRRKGSRAPEALQETFTPQVSQTQHLDDGLIPNTLQDSFCIQPAVLVGFMAQLTGLSFHEDIAMTARRLQQLGRDILWGSPHHQGGFQDAQTPHRVDQTPDGSPTMQLGRSAPGP